MAPWARVPLCLVAGVALAACLGAPEHAGPADVADAGCDGAPCGEGALSGMVVDDEQRPLAGVDLRLAPGDFAAVSDDGGLFAFPLVPAGPYDLGALREGFAPFVLAIEIAATEPLNVTVRLTPVHVEHAFHETIGPLSGMFTCGIGTPARIAMCHTYADSAFSDDQPRLSFRMSAPHWQTFVGEMRWTQGTAASSTHLANYMTFDGAKNGVHWWCAADGPSPTMFRFERTLASVCSDQGVTNPLPSPDMTLVVGADVGFAGTDTSDPPLRAAVEQRFHLMMTIFYGTPGPPDWTAFADA